MRLIDADELEAMVKRLIELTPTADPVTHETAIDFLSEEGWLHEHDRILTESAVKHGRWFAHDSSTKAVPIEACSICYVWSYGYNENYCPHCGAKMDEVEE